MRAPAATLATARAPCAHGVRHLLPALLLVLAALAPTAAIAFTLPQLLQMPLERLLQLHIDTPSATPALPRPRS